MTTPTFPQMQHFFTLVAEGKITTENFQKFLGNPSWFAKESTFPSSAIAAKYGYMVVSDVEPSQFKVKDIKLITFLKKGESCVTGETMRQRAVILKGNFGLVDGQYLLDNQEKIPNGMRGKCIVLPGTLLRSFGGDVRVAYLYWNGGQWVPRFYWVGFDWFGNDRFACCK